MKVRLARALALAGVASRRKAEDLIRAGKVRVNGQKVDTPAACVTPGRDAIEVGSRRIENEPKEYYLVNKPAGVLTTVSDARRRRTIRQLVPQSRARLFPVGRLDKDTTGLILLTNDGELAHHLMHPRYGMERIYHAEVKGRPTPKALNRLRKGLWFGKKWARVKRISVLRQGRDRTELELVLGEGWKHEARILLATVGYPVKALERVQVAGFKLTGLKRGQSRRLKTSEIQKLKQFVEAGKEQDPPRVHSGRRTVRHEEKKTRQVRG